MGKLRHRSLQGCAHKGRGGWSKARMGTWISSSQFYRAVKSMSLKVHSLHLCLGKWESWIDIYTLLLSRFSRVQLFVTPWTVAHQAPLSVGFSRQRYWSGLSCPCPGDLPNPGIKLMPLMSPALAGRFFTTSTTWEPCPFGNHKIIFFVYESVSSL